MDLFYTQEKAKNELDQHLSTNNIVLLYGNSGTGKTALAKYYAEKCCDSEVIITEYSDNSFRNSNMQTFKMALGNANIKNIGETEDLFLGAVVQDLPVPKNSFLYILNRFKNKNQDKFDAEYFDVFNESEKSIIVKLSKVSKKKQLLLIFDNYHWANVNDINFINNFTKTLNNTKLFQNPIKIILVATTNQNENPDFNISNLIDIIPSVNINSITVIRYKEILNIMGLKESLSDKAIETIYSLTSGHLELTKRVVEYINTQGNSLISFTGDLEKQAMAMMSEIFDHMLNISLKNKRDTIDILEIASVIGNIFNQYELKALTKEEIFQIEKQLIDAKDEHFIEMKNDMAQFIHPIICELFYKKLDDKQYSYHKKFAEELKTLKPTEHLERAYHLKICKDYNVVLQEYIIAFILSTLSQQHFPESIYNEIQVEIKKHKLENYFSSMEKALKYYILGQVDESIKCLDNIDRLDMTTSLYSSLKDFLYAKNLLLLKYDTNSFLYSAELLEKAKQCFLSNMEYEMYVCCLLILLNIYSYKLCDIDAAQKTEQQIVHLFHSELKECIDSKMDDYRFEYKRKSCSICIPEIACKKTKEALTHFQNSDNIMELYKSACDHSATCLYLGRFNEALEAIEVCGKVVEEYDLLSFPESFKPQNNYILASLYSNPDGFWDKIKDAINIYRQVLDNNSYITKIINVNLSGLLILDGQLDEAEDTLIQLNTSLTEYASVYYNTFIYGNLTSIYILRKNYERALYYLELLENYLDEWSENTQKFYRMQANLLRQIVESHEQLTPHQLFMRPIELLPEYLGSTWQFIGRGVLFSELLFYTT